MKEMSGGKDFDLNDLKMPELLEGTKLDDLDLVDVSDYVSDSDLADLGPLREFPELQNEKSSSKLTESSARNNNLKPEEIQEGTYTLTNIGNFGSIMGTPIINQPQVGILAIGAIRKMPAVIETPDGDFIGVRRKVILSHSYDHRIINGATGGLFVKRVAEYLENWDETLTF